MPHSLARHAPRALQLDPHLSIPRAFGGLISTNTSPRAPSDQITPGRAPRDRSRHPSLLPPITCCVRDDSQIYSPQKLHLRYTCDSPRPWRRRAAGHGSCSQLRSTIQTTIPQREPVGEARPGLLQEPTRPSRPDYEQRLSVPGYTRQTSGSASDWWLRAPLVLIPQLLFHLRREVLSDVELPTHLIWGLICHAMEI